MHPPESLDPLEPRRLLSASYTVADLGVLGHHEDEYSEAYAINNRGQVAGISDTDDLFFVDEDGVPFYVNHAVRWDAKDGMADLSPAGVFSAATNLNDKGDLVGAATFPDLPGGDNGYAALWDKHGRLTSLGTLPGTLASTAWGINNRGDVVGWAYNSDPESPPVTSPPNSVAFIYDKHDGLRALPIPAGFKNAFAGDVNNSGIAAGYAADNTALHPIAWLPGPRRSYIPVLLQIPDGFIGGDSRAVNDLGQVAGSLRQATGISDAFVWTPAGVPGAYVATDIGRPRRATRAEPRDINDAGEIVGVARINNRNRAFLYDPATGMHNLNDLLPDDSGWILTNARGINEQGQITGLGIHDGELHAFVLSPVQESVAPAGDTPTPPPAAPERHSFSTRRLFAADSDDVF